MKRQWLLTAVGCFNSRKVRWRKEGEVVAGRRNENEVIVIVCAGETGQGKRSLGNYVQWERGWEVMIEIMWAGEQGERTRRAREVGYVVERK